MTSLSLLLKWDKPYPAPLISVWKEKLARPIEIDMGANPFDMRPAAHAIVNRIEGMKELYPDEPLIVPMGERHDQPSTQLMQQAVMQECLYRGLIPSYAMEVSHLKLGKYLSTFGVECDAKAIATLKQDDPHNELLRQLAHILFLDPVHAQHIAFCQDNGLSLSFNDAADFEAKGEEYFIDYSDPLTCRMARELGYNTSLAELEKSIEDDLVANDDDLLLFEHGGHYCVSKTGFHIRNHVMVHNTMAQWHAQKPDAIILGTGMAHVFGIENKAADFMSPYSESLTSLFRAKTQGVIPLSFDWNALTLPRDVDARHSVILRNVPHVTGDACAVMSMVEQESGGLVIGYPELDDDAMAEEYRTLYNMLKQRNLYEYVPR